MAPALYVGSTEIDGFLPPFRAANDLPFGDRAPLASIWLGNRTTIAAHYDLPDNLACVVAGRRRFTLFPPEQLPNLYVGPLDLTPAGQPISLVDMAHPDLARHPRFAQALDHAQVAELEPGDALFIPSMWWHQVESLEPFNVLVNYWWRQSAAYLDSPIVALMAALLTLRDLPAHQRETWRDHVRPLRVPPHRRHRRAHSPARAQRDGAAVRRRRAQPAPGPPQPLQTLRPT